MVGCQRAAPWLLLIIIGVPALELAVIISVGGAIGVWPTVISVFLTAIIGLSIIRPQSRTLMVKAQERMAAGEPPREETFHGICLALAGAMLMFPGFVTDALGFLLLLPPLRNQLYALTNRRFAEAARKHDAAANQSGPTVVDGDFEEIANDSSHDDKMPPPRGGWG